MRVKSRPSSWLLRTNLIWQPSLPTFLTDAEYDAGYRVETVAEFSDGAVLLSASHPALLVANVMLPDGGNGYRLADLAHRLQIPTLLISGHPEIIEQQEGGGIPFLAKPFGAADLERAINHLLQSEHDGAVPEPPIGRAMHDEPP
jgi:DNA-binding response OmpR family regulator